MGAQPIRIDQLNIQVKYDHNWSDSLSNDLVMNIEAEVRFGAPAEAGEYEDTPDYVHVSRVGIGAASVVFLNLPVETQKAIESRCLDKARAMLDEETLELI